mgnify:CR=1 FL=1
MPLNSKTHKTELYHFEFISFVKTLIDTGLNESVIIDDKENPIEVKNLNDFFQTLISAYTSATTEYEAEYAKLKKMRSIKKIMDW